MALKMRRSSLKTWCSPAALLFAITPAIGLAAAAKAKPENSHWVATWATSPSPSSPDDTMRRRRLEFNEQTLREIVHITIGGDRFRVRLSNAFGTKAVPAVSVGIIHKSASGVAGNSKYEVGDLVAGWFGPNVKSEGNDFYVVATKLIPQLPRPVLLSAGLLATDGYATGVLGFDDKHKGTGFGNVDIVWPLGFTTGFEYQQGVKFSDYKNPNYWDLHLAWFATPNITAVLAYVNAGDVKSTDYFGLGEGTVLSLQHTF